VAAASPGARPPIVGLRREREVLTVALDTGRHVVIEGPPGTGKSTLLRDIARQAGRDVVFVEGNAELTPARLIGQYDPAQVLAGGYVPASFSDGPLLRAMRAGALLYVEEFNRIPEETLNVLITVLTDGEITVPRLGPVVAEPGFRLVAAMNPFDAIGTARVSQAIADRICRVVLGYQDAAAERQITSSVTGANGQVVNFAVTLTRATREHRDVQMGASVRGSIDLVLLLTGLARLRGEASLARPTARDAAYAALSGRIRIADGCDRSPESVLDDLLAELWPADLPQPRLADGDGSAVEDRADDDDGGEGGSPPGGQGKADGLPASRATAGGLSGRPRPVSRRDRAGGSSARTLGRAELAARHPSFAAASPAVGQLDQEAFTRALAADPELAVTLLADLSHATDKELRAAAHRLAARVFFRLGRAAGQPSRGVRQLGVLAGDGDLDLERTIDRWAGQWPPDSADLVTRGWQARRRAVCLLIDASGSMSGLAVGIAAVAGASVVLAAGGRLSTGILAFSAGITVLQVQGSRRPHDELVTELVRLRGHGLTNLAGALRAASAQLANAPAGERVAVLLSDCLATTGGDPAQALGGISRLHVLCPLPSTESELAAAALARLGGGISVPVRRLADVAPALSRLLS
jgi:magnesium chelatase subunit D